jgi:hypothetical protein
MWLGCFETVSEYELTKKRHQQKIENTKPEDEVTIPEVVVTGL